MEKYMFRETIFVGIKTSFRGVHNWPEASDFAGPQVDFLEDLHRHTFHVEVEMEVDHEDRAVEFFVLQNSIDDMIGGLYPYEGLAYQLGRRSCETIGRELLGQIRTTFPQALRVRIRVSEDNEVWAKIESAPVALAPTKEEIAEVLDPLLKNPPF